jgi:hypothetical protein
MKLFLSKIKIPLIILAVVFVFAFVIWWQITQSDKAPSRSNIFSFQFNSPKLYNQQQIIQIGNFSLSFFPLSASASTQSVSGDAIRYTDAYPYTDVIQTKSYSRIKEEMILKQPGHPMEFKYQLNADQYDWQLENGSLVFYTKGQKGNELNKLFTIPVPFLIDSNNVKSYDAVKMELKDNILLFTLDQTWLNRLNYPITLDPTVEINIINVHSHPAQGDNWTVSFTTQGQADLKIIPNDQATIDDDEFVSLSCDGQNVQPQILSGDVIFYPNWQCAGTGQVVHYTKKAGNHTLRFEFGDQVSYAYNSAFGPRSPQTSADDASDGVQAWSTTDNIFSSDLNYAQVSLNTLFSMNPSHYLKATNFGFSIPTGATINGIKVEVEVKCSLSASNDWKVYLIKDGTIQTATNRANYSTFPTSDGIYTTYGDSSDLWGNTWTADKINASNFGFAYEVSASGDTDVVYVDHIRITVYYTGGGAKSQANAPRSTGVNSSGLVGYWSFNGQDTKWNSGSANSFSYVSSAANSGESDLTIGPVTFGAGHLLVAWAKWEQAAGGSGISQLTDGTNDFTLATLTDNGTDMHSQFAYMLSANGGSRTYTISIDKDGGNTAEFVEWEIMEFSYSGTASIDTGNLGTGMHNPTVVSGNITLAGSSDELVVGGGSSYQYDAGTGWSNRLINEKAADGFLDGWGPYTTMFYKKISSGTMHAQADTIQDDLWICDVIAFKSTSGSNIAYDRSGSGLNGAISNMSIKTSPAEGLLGQALKFDGVDDYVDLGDIDAVDGVTRITVAAWVKWGGSPGGMTSEKHIIEKDSCDAGHFELYGGGGSAFAAAHKVNFYIGSSEPSQYDSGASVTSIDDGKWHFLTGTYDGSYVRIYVDGVDETDGAASNKTLNSNPYSVDIGGNCNGSGQVQGFLWPGMMDEVRLWSRALSASEIKNLYQTGASKMAVNTRSTAAPDSSGLVGFWSFNGPDTIWSSATGGTAYDRSGISPANNGTMTSMSRSSSITEGISGQAMKFDGIDDIVHNTSVDLSGTSKASVSLWMYERTDFATDGIFIENSDSVNSNTGFVFAIGPECSTSQFELGISTGALYNSRCFSVPSAKAWHHYVATYDTSQAQANEMQLYIDGVLQAGSNGSLTGENSGNFNTTFNIGARYGTPASHGHVNIDEVRLYSRVLSASEAKNLYQVGARRTKP